MGNMTERVIQAGPSVQGCQNPLSQWNTCREHYGESPKLFYVAQRIVGGSLLELSFDVVAPWKKRRRLANQTSWVPGIVFHWHRYRLAMGKTVEGDLRENVSRKCRVVVILFQGCILNSLGTNICRQY